MTMSICAHGKFLWNWNEIPVYKYLNNVLKVLINEILLKIKMERKKTRKRCRLTCIPNNISFVCLPSTCAYAYKCSSNYTLYREQRFHCTVNSNSHNFQGWWKKIVWNEVVTGKTEWFCLQVKRAKTWKKQIICCSNYMFKLLYISGSCKDEDRQKGSPCNYWEILHEVNTWFSYKQEGMWRDSHLTQ